MPQIVQLPLTYGPQAATAQMMAGMAQNAEFQRVGIARNAAEANAAEDKRRGDLFAARDQFERDRVAKTDQEKEDAKAAAAKLDAMGIAMAKMGKRPAGAAQRPGFAPGIGQIPTADARSNQLVRRWDAASDDYLKEALSHLSVLPPEMAAAYREQIMQHARERGNVNDLIQLKGRKQELAEQGMFMGAGVDLAGQVSAKPDPEIEGQLAALDSAIEAGTIDYEQAQTQMQGILGEATRRRGNAQNIAQRVQNFEAGLAQAREMTKRPLSYAGQLLDNLKLMSAGASDDEIKKKLAWFDSEITQAMSGKRPVTDGDGRTWYMDEAQAPDFERRVQKMSEQQAELGQAQIDVLRTRISAANKELTGEYELSQPSEYMVAARKIVGDLGETSEVVEMAKQLMTMDSLDKVRRANEKNPKKAEAGAEPAKPTGPQAFSALGKDEKNALAREYNQILRAKGPMAAVSFAKSKNVDVLADARGDGSLPVEGANPIEDARQKIEEVKANSEAVLKSPDDYTAEEVAAAREDARRLRTDKAKLAKLDELSKKYPGLDTEDGWLMTMNRVQAASKRHPTPFQSRHPRGIQAGGSPDGVAWSDIQSSKSDLELLGWLGEQNGWQYSADAAKEAAARLRAKK